MRKSVYVALWLFLLLTWLPLSAQDGLVPAFELEPCEIALQRLAKPGTPFDKCGRRFALLGEEGGSFEAWAYPLKILRGFNFSFYIGESTRPIQAKDIVRYIEVTPEATILTFTYQSFTIKAVYITPMEQPGAIILLDVDSSVPVSIVCGFLPVLQPMWPAGIGGQFAYWNNDLKAYVISESSGKNHGLVGSPAAAGLSYTPAHMLSDSPSEFRIPIPEPQKVRGKFIPIYLAGGKGKREAVVSIYKKLQEEPKKYYLENREHFRRLQNNTLGIKTPDKKLNLAYAWAKIAFDNLIVENPELGKGMVAGLGASGTSGRPGFGWFFGGDAYINSLSLGAYGAFDTVHDILAFTQKWQRKDGKMAHELSQAEGYIDWWNDYPYGYIHGDTTPYYIVAMYEYAKASGDRDFIKSSWESLQRAYNWCRSTDTNADGLMDNKQAGLGALEYGALTGIETDVYLGAVWVRATLAMQGLARIVRDAEYIELAKNDHQRASGAFEKRFWDEDNSYYAYAFNEDGEHVKEISPWNAVGLMWRQGTPEHSRASLERISSAELVTDWGVRSISINSKYFQPLNYNYGAVWPFLTSWVTTALYTHNMPLNAWPMLKATAGHTFNNALGGITEVFSGTNHVWPQEAVSHQGFSTAGVTLPLLRGMLGLEGNAVTKTVALSPQFPADWDRVQVKNIRIGEAVFSLDFHKQPGQIRMTIEADNAADYRLTLAPALGPAAHIIAVEINGHAVEYSLERGAQNIHPTVKQVLNENPLTLDIRYIPGPEIFVAPTPSLVGATNMDLKVISLIKEDDVLILKLEGISGQPYTLNLNHPERVKTVLGGALEENRITLEILGKQDAGYRIHMLRIQVKKQP